MIVLLIVKLGSDGDILRSVNNLLGHVDSLHWTKVQYAAFQLFDRTRGNRFSLMAVEKYKGRVIISRPSYERRLGVWIPFSMVTSRDDDGMNTQVFRDLPKTQTRPEAVADGITAARAWIDKNS